MAKVFYILSMMEETKYNKNFKLKIIFLYLIALKIIAAQIFFIPF